MELAAIETETQRLSHVCLTLSDSVWRSTTGCLVLGVWFWMFDSFTVRFYEQTALYQSLRAHAEGSTYEAVSLLL